MGWFDNQIKTRREADQQLLDDSFVRVAGVVMGQRRAEAFGDDRIVTKNAIDEILKYYHYRTLDLPDSIKSPDDQLDYCLRPHGIMRRSIKLTEGWEIHPELLEVLNEKNANGQKKFFAIDKYKTHKKMTFTTLVAFKKQ